VESELFLETCATLGLDICGLSQLRMTMLVLCALPPGPMRPTLPLGRILWLASVPVPEDAMTNSLGRPSSGSHGHEDIIIAVKDLLLLALEKASSSLASPESRHRESGTTT
jgi:hypothetical protein